MHENIAQQMYDALATAFTALDQGRALKAKERNEVLEKAALALSLWEERDWPVNTNKEQCHANL